MSQQQQLETLVELLAAGGINATWHDEDEENEVQEHWQVSSHPDQHIAELIDLLGASGIGAFYIAEEDGVDAHWEVGLPDAPEAEPEVVAELKEENDELKRELKQLQIDRDQWKKKARARR